jgi:hypothetical protein
MCADFELLLGLKHTQLNSTWVVMVPHHAAAARVSAHVFILVVALPLIHTCRHAADICPVQWC